MIPERVDLQIDLRARPRHRDAEGRAIPDGALGDTTLCDTRAKEMPS